MFIDLIVAVETTKSLHNSDKNLNQSFYNVQDTIEMI